VEGVVLTTLLLAVLGTAMNVPFYHRSRRPANNVIAELGFHHARSLPHFQGEGRLFKFSCHAALAELAEVPPLALEGQSE